MTLSPLDSRIETSRDRNYLFLKDMVDMYRLPEQHLQLSHSQKRLRGTLRLLSLLHRVFPGMGIVSIVQ